VLASFAAGAVILAGGAVATHESLPTWGLLVPLAGLWYWFVRVRTIQRSGSRRRTTLVRTVVSPGVARLRKLTPLQFEHWVARQLQQAGFHVIHTGRQADHGIDLLIERNGVRAVVQCKRYRDQLVQEAVLRDLYGAMHAENARSAYVVTTHRFSEGALHWANGKPLVLWDAFTLEQLASADITPSVVPRVIPAPVLVCRCGGMRIRTKRQAGWVLGCTRYPRCRRAEIAIHASHVN